MRSTSPSMRFLQALIPIVFVCAAMQVGTLAKCISLRLSLRGQIEGVASGDKVIVEVASATEGDSHTHVRQETLIKGSAFQVLAWFNTTSNVVSTETCDRKPHLVEVKLMGEAQVLDRVALTVERDFRRTSEGDYVLKNPITLHRGKAAAARRVE